MHALYATINTINQKFYIGVHDLDRDKNYEGSGTRLHLAMRKYGRNKFDFLILKEFETAAEAYAEEARVVDQVFIDREDTYNVHPGGIGGTGARHTFQAREKMRGKRPAFSKKMIGNKHGVGNKNGLGHLHTEEWKAAKSLQMRGKKRPQLGCSKLKGRTRPDISARMKGNQYRRKHPVSCE